MFKSNCQDICIGFLAVFRSIVVGVSLPYYSSPLYFSYLSFYDRTDISLAFSTVSFLGFTGDLDYVSLMLTTVNSPKQF